MTLYNISARLNRDHISARTTRVMWREECLSNVGVLQRVRLFNFISSYSAVHQIYPKCCDIVNQQYKTITYCKV
jgi:hypothetical protein